MKPKTAKVKSWDPTTQRYKYETVKVEGYYFNDEDRMRICSEFLESGESASVFVEKYHLNSKEVLYGWVKKFLDGKNCVPLESFVTPDPMKEKSNESHLNELHADNNLLKYSFYPFCHMTQQNKQDTGIEPASSAWEADALPMDESCTYTALL